MSDQYKRIIYCGSLVKDRMNEDIIAKEIRGE